MPLLMIGALAALVVAAVATSGQTARGDERRRAATSPNRSGIRSSGGRVIPKPATIFGIPLPNIGAGGGGVPAALAETIDALSGVAENVVTVATSSFSAGSLPDTEVAPSGGTLIWDPPVPTGGPEGPPSPPPIEPPDPGDPWIEPKVTDTGTTPTPQPPSGGGGNDPVIDPGFVTAPPAPVADDYMQQAPKTPGGGGLAYPAYKIGETYVDPSGLGSGGGYGGEAASGPMLTSGGGEYGWFDLPSSSYNPPDGSQVAQGGGGGSALNS